MTSIWSEESIAHLKTGYKEGKSASIIGEELTKEFEKDFSRNAVVGKVFRLKLGKKRPPVIFKPNGRCKAKAMTRYGYKSQTPVNGSNYTTHNVVELFVLPEINIDQTPPLMVCIDELDQASITAGGRCSMCRYPSGDPRGDMRYCGLPTGGKSSWCSYHRQITVRASIYKTIT